MRRLVEQPTVEVISARRDRRDAVSAWVKDNDQTWTQPLAAGSQALLARLGGSRCAERRTGAICRKNDDYHGTPRLRVSAARSGRSGLRRLLYQRRTARVSTLLRKRSP